MPADDVLSGVEPLTAEEEAAIRESFAAGMRLDRTAAVVFAREDIARLLATLDAARSVPVTEDGLDEQRLADAMAEVEGDLGIAEVDLVRRSRLVWATKIAAEYARLGSADAATVAALASTERAAGEPHARGETCSICGALPPGPHGLGCQGLRRLREPRQTEVRSRLDAFIDPERNAQEIADAAAIYAPEPRQTEGGAE